MIQFSKKCSKSLLIIFFILILFSIWVNSRFLALSNNYIHDSASDLPACETGLLLGTNKLLNSGQPNEYFSKRIQAAAELYKAGKICRIIASGSKREDENEPLDMKSALMKQGVPDSVILLDEKGYRTINSVTRAKDVFGQSCIIFISQEFHNRRAVYLARHYGMEAYGYNAADVSAYKGFRTLIREYFARQKAFWEALFL